MGGDEPKRTKEADKPDAALDFLRLLRGPGKATGDQEKTVVQRMQDLVTEYLRPNSSLDKLKPRFEAVIKDADQPISAKRRDELRRDFARLQEQLDSCLQPPPDGVSVSKAIADQDKAIKAGIAALKPDAVRTEAQ